MAIPKLGTDQPAAPCCDSWFELIERMVSTAGEAVRSCVPGCEAFPYYVSHGVPVGGGDYLAAWLAGTDNLAEFNQRIFFPRIRLTVAFALCQVGYPGPEITGNGIESVPSPAEHTHASLFSYGAAQAAYQATLKSISGGCIGGCKVASIATLRPDQPESFNARWRWNVLLDAD